MNGLGTGTSVLIPQPHWLKPGFFRKHNCNYVRQERETYDELEAPERGKGDRLSDE